MHDEPDLHELTLTGVMSALADPVRVTILREIAARGESACGTFELGVTKATRSHHFNVLREPGLTRTRAVGTHRYVSLRSEDVEERFPGLLTAVLAAAEAEVSVLRA